MGLATKLDDLSLILRSHMVEGEDRIVFCPLHKTDQQINQFINQLEM